MVLALTKAKVGLSCLLCPRGWPEAVALGRFPVLFVLRSIFCFCHAQLSRQRCIFHIVSKFTDPTDRSEPPKTGPDPQDGPKTGPRRPKISQGGPRPPAENGNGLLSRTLLPTKNRTTTFNLGWRDSRSDYNPQPNGSRCEVHGVTRVENLIRKGSIHICSPEFGLRDWDRRSHAQGFRLQLVSSMFE